MKKINVFVWLIISVTLSACGGGSGGDETQNMSGDVPVLSLLGGDNVLVEQSSIYDEAGVEAFDTEDGDITANVVVDGVVDTTTPGSYTITYDVTDSNGNAAQSISRSVFVAEPLSLIVDATLISDVGEIEDPDGGAPRPVGVITGLGKKAHLVENEIMIATDDNAVINDFLTRWSGVLLETVELNGTPNLHTIYVDPTSVSLNDLEAHIDSISELAFGETRFSSENILKLYAIVAAEIALRDLTISLNWVTTTQSIRSGSAAEQLSSDDSDYSPNPFQWPYMNRGSNQNTGVTAAWQTLNLLGVSATPATAQRVMVIDSGFLDIGDYIRATTPAGAGWGQRSSAGCSSESCYWHGTEVAHVALGAPDNDIGIAGSAGPYAALEPVQFSGLDFRGLGRIFGILFSAPINGPPAVINISGSVDVPAPFNVGLNQFLDPLFNRGLDLGILVVAAAGNDGENVDDSFWFFFRTIETSTTIPCETSSVVCVGGLQWDSTRKHGNSNYGSEAEQDSVDIYASYEYWVPAIDADGVDLATIEKGRGTSFSAPFVSGVIAMMNAANPGIDADDAVNCLLRSAHQNDGVQVHSRGGNQRRVDAFESVVCALGRRVNFPLLEIDLPTDGLTVPGIIDLIVSAASMSQDGVTLPVQWSSSLDGSLGVYSPGVEVPFNNLSIGTHELTAQVTDSNGDTASQSVTVTITNTPPTANILSPQENETFGVGQSIPLSAVTEDLDGFPSTRLDDSQISWRVTGTTFSGAGNNTTIPAGVLGIGNYTVTLEADDGTDIAQDSVNFSVTECTGSCPTASIIAPGNTVIRTSTSDEEGRIYADVTFEGFATDDEDGGFAGRVNDGPMIWTSVNESSQIVNICTPFILEPPLVPVRQEAVCDTFTERFYLNDSGPDGTSYYITLEVTDSDGNRATDLIELTLLFDLI